MKKPYTHKKWLEHQYWDLEKSEHKIAKECGRNQTTILYWLKKLKIKTRSRPVAIRIAVCKHVHLSKNAKEFLNGELLGDASINKCRNWSPAICYGSQYEGYLKWFAKELTHFGLEQSGKIYKHKKRVKFPDRVSLTTSYWYSSRHYVELEQWHKKWYRRPTIVELEKYPWRKYMKQLPVDLKLTPLVCRQWFIGDGNPGRIKTTRFSYFCTQGFLNKEVDFLAYLLTDLGFKITKQKDRQLYLSTKSVNDFLDYIGPCPKEIIDFYGYKWG